MAQFDQPAAAGPVPDQSGPAPAERISPRRAFAEIAAVYAASFGLGVVSAIVLLKDPNFDSSGNVIDGLQSAALEIFSYVMQAAVVIFGVGYFSLRRGLTLSALFGRIKRPAPYSAQLYPVAGPYGAGPYGAASYGAGPYGAAPYAAPPSAANLVPQADGQAAGQPSPPAVAPWGAGFQTQPPAYPQAGYPNGYPQPSYPQVGYPQAGFGVRQPVERSPGWQFARVFFLAMGGFIAFLIVAVIYAAVTGQTTGAPSQGSSLWLIPVGVFVSAAAGFGEEMLITGMVVTTLEQAGFGKRAWVIYLVAIALRIPFHLYYGWAAVGVICFTVVNIWIYRRWRLLWPIVLAHAAYDLIESASQTIPGNAAGLPILGLALVTIVMVIVIACVEGSDASARRRYRAFTASQGGLFPTGLLTPTVGQAGLSQSGQYPQPPQQAAQAQPFEAPAQQPLQPSQFTWAGHQPQSPPQPEPSDAPAQSPAQPIHVTEAAAQPQPQAAQFSEAPAQLPSAPEVPPSPQFPNF